MKLKLTTQQPFNSKYNRPIDKAGTFHLVEMVIIVIIIIGLENTRYYLLTEQNKFWSSAINITYICILGIRLVNKPITGIHFVHSDSADDFIRFSMAYSWQAVCQSVKPGLFLTKIISETK